MAIKFYSQNPQRLIFQVVRGYTKIFDTASFPFENLFMSTPVKMSVQTDIDNAAFLYQPREITYTAVFSVRGIMKHEYMRLLMIRIRLS